MAAKIKLPDFWVSFFVLGLAMTAPEISVGISSVLTKNPDVYVGNLLGSTMAIFLLAIPLMAIMGGGVTLIGKISNNKMIMSLGMVVLPFLLIINGEMNIFKGFLCMLAYLFLAVYFGIKANGEKVINCINRKRLSKKPWLWEITKFVLGIGIIMLSGRVLVGSIEYMVGIFGGSLYVVGFFLLSLGTTAPEMMVVVKSIVGGKKDVAFGGYLGSAVANSLLFGSLSVVSGSFVIEMGIYFVLLAVLVLFGLVIFYLFSKSKDELSRVEGIVLVLFYFLAAGLTAF